MAMQPSGVGCIQPLDSIVVVVVVVIVAAAATIAVTVSVSVSVLLLAVVISTWLRLPNSADGRFFKNTCVYHHRVTGHTFHLNSAVSISVDFYRCRVVCL